MTGFLTTKRYNYATVYVDQFTRFGYVYLQKTASAEETIESKRAFEAAARRHGVRIQHYHADNGIFKANAWVEACRKDGQGMTYAGVNAHHQNGIAERRIRELQELARQSNAHTCKCSMEGQCNGKSVAVCNSHGKRSSKQDNTPSFQDPNKRTPIELFSGTKATSNPKHWKPFGCPTYVLDNDLQGRKPFHKWRQRSKPGIYLGVSPVHDRNVALVLDCDTGLASPQFHVAFDPRFDTAKDITTESKWQLKAGGFVIQRELYEQKRARIPSTEKPIGDNMSSRERRKRKRSEATTEQQQETMESHELSTQPAAANVGDGGHPTPSNESGTQREAEREYTTTRSGRKAKAAPRLIEAMTSEIARATANDVEGEIYCYATIFPDDDEINHVNPLLAYKAVSEPDTLYYHQAMKEHDSEEFRDSMDKEVRDQFENGNFTVVHRSQVPDGHTILPAVWQMRRKRDAKTGAMQKHKARLNIDGSRMRKGEHYDMTYSPVASWNSVRMLLTLTALHGLTTKQIDFVQAFAQAPIEKSLYMKIPAGMEITDGSDPRDYVLMIHRNIYGQKQAGRVWNQYLVGNSCGNKASGNPLWTNVCFTGEKRSMSSTPTTVCWQDRTQKKSMPSSMNYSERQS